MKLHKQTQAALQISILALLVGGIFGYWIRLSTETPHQTVIAAPQITPRIRSGNNISYPTTITAQRARAYPGGYISDEGEIGQHDGYNLSKISYPSEGYKIYALVATPTTPRPEKGYPTIILAHGYIDPNVYKTEGSEYAEYIAAFARRGYVVVKPDFRGNGESWGTPRSAYFNSDYTADILNLASSLAHFSPVNVTKMVIWGHSMGGHVALDALTVKPNQFKAAVLYAASIGTIDEMYYDWVAPSEKNSISAQAEKKRVAKLFGEPHANPTFWSQLSPLSYGDSIETPIQIHHGAADNVIPEKFSRDAADALSVAGVTLQYFDYPKAGHVFTGADRDTLIERSLAWFDQYTAK